MANQLLKVYRDALASQGLSDDTPDDQLTLQLGQQAEQQDRSLFEKYPDFGQEYGALRETAAPSLTGEFGNAAVQGTRSLGATTLGGVAAITGSQSLRNTARSFDEPQEGTAPTIPTLEDIAPGESGLSRVFSKDTARYFLSKAGGAIPSLAEGAALSAAGAGIGSLAGPGGTAAGAVEGAAEGLLGRGLIKMAIRRLVSNGILDSEAAGAAALEGGNTAASQLILNQAKVLAKRSGGEAVNALNAYTQSTGAIYNETGDQGSALGLGALAAIPNTGLTHIALKKFFPDLTGKALSNAGLDYVKRTALEGLKTAGIGATGSAAQESANLVARNLNEGRDAFDWSDDDLKRLREAAIGGGVGGALLAPLAAYGGRATDKLPPPTEKANLRNNISVVDNISYPSDTISQIKAMSPEVRTARLAELDAKDTQTPGEFKEAALLRKFSPIPIFDEGTEGILPPKAVIDSLPPAEDPTLINNEVNSVVDQQRTQQQDAEIQGALDQQRNLRRTLQTVEDPSSPQSAELLRQQLELEQADAERTAQTQKILSEATPEAELARVAPLPEPEPVPVSEIVPTEKTEVPVRTEPGEPAPKYQYTIQQPEPGIHNGYTQIDEIQPDGTNSDSSSIADLRSRGVDLPEPPPWLPTGRYTEEQVRDAKANPPETATPPPSEVVPLPTDPLAQAALPDNAPPPVELAPPLNIEVPPENQVAPPPEPNPLPAQQAVAEVFNFGKIAEGEGIPFRNEPDIQNADPDKFVAALAAQTKGNFDSSGNRSRTRGALVLEAPDGSIVKAGLIQPQNQKGLAGQDVGGELSLQRMGKKTAEGKVVQPGGDSPVTVAELMREGFKPIEYVKFDAEPGKIFQTFPNIEAYDRANAATERTTGKKTQMKLSVGAGLGAELSQRSTKAQLANVEARISQVAEEMGKHAKGSKELNALLDEYNNILVPRQAELSIKDQQETGNAQLPAYRQAEIYRDARKVERFQIGVARLAQMGVKVDLFATEFLRQQTANPEAQAVTYDPYHIALGVEDVLNANIGNLVSLFHEGVHSLIGRIGGDEAAGIPPIDAAMARRIATSAENAVADLRSQAEGASSRTGVDLSKIVNAEDQLAETIAQRLAADGIQQAPSIAQALVRWVKDLYYRTAMAIQAGFGVQASDKFVLGWLENQFRREMNGDYSYGFHSFTDRFQPESTVDQVGRHQVTGGTPRGISDYHDPYTLKQTQPEVSSATLDGARWNLKYQTHDDVPEGMSPHEGYHRVLAATANEVQRIAQQLFSDLKITTTFEQFWKIVGHGDLPAAILQNVKESVPGAEIAQIGGDGMTDTMNGRANLMAREIVQKMQSGALDTAAKKALEVTQKSTELVEKSQRVNVLENNFRDADMHERIFRDSVKLMIKDMAKDVHDGLDLSKRAGSLDQAIRQLANISESEAIPKQYQDFLERQVTGGINLFNYLKAVSDMDLDLGNMKVREIIKAVKENADDNLVLHELVDHKPTLAAIVALARDNALQVDLVQLGRLKNMDLLHSINEDIKQIRTATDQGLSSMLELSDRRAAGRGLAQRIKINMIEERQEFRRTQESLKKATYQSDLLRDVNTRLQPFVDDLQKTAGSYSDWKVSAGAEWTAMQLQKDGTWLPEKRTITLNPDGSHKNPADLEHDLVMNRNYLEQNKKLSGTTAYQAIRRQTDELAFERFEAAYPQARRTLIDRLIQPLVDEFRAIGGNAGNRGANMMIHQQLVERGGRGKMKVLSAQWNHAYNEAMKAAGFKDFGQFKKQIFNPVMYSHGTELGLNEQQSIRQSIRVARARLPAPPTENFNKAMESMIRATKAVNDYAVHIAESNGVYVQDDRIGGQLRRVVDQGWLTNMRRMSTDTIGTIVSDMGPAGWTNDFTVSKRPDGSPVKKVVRSTTFNDVTPELAANPDALRQKLNPYFTPGIIGRWLEPILKASGPDRFMIDGKRIDQLQVNHAWQESAGDVVGFFDALAAERNIKPDDLPAFRLDMLKQISALYGMYSKVAWDANQTRNLFDPHGPRQHLLMDARVNDLMPPEHIDFQTYEPRTADALLATIAHHAAFGRNGSEMAKALTEMKSNVEVGRKHFSDLEGSSVKIRKLDAAAKGWDYDQIKRDARTADDVTALQQKVEQLFSPQNQSGPLGDARAGLEMLGFVVGQTVNNVKTGLLNLVTLTDRPPVQGSLSLDTIGNTAYTLGQFGRNMFGSLLEDFGNHMMRSSEYAKWIGEAEGVGFGRLPYGVALSDSGKGGNFQSSNTDAYLIRPFRKIAAFQRRGVGLTPFGESREFARQNIIPGLGGITHYLSQQSGIANGLGQVHQYELIVKRAINFFAANPEKASDPTYKLTPKDLKMNNKWGFGSQGVFDYYRNKTAEYRIGNLEQVAKEASVRQANNQTLLTRDQVVALGMTSANELNLEASINTRPGALSTNPILKYGMPLLGWPLEKMNSIHKAMRTPEGQYDGLKVLKTLGHLAMWNLPMGMAFTMAMDRFDKKFIGKKSNMTDVDWQTAVPIVGPALALMGAGKLTPQQNIMGMLERQAKAGNIYGLGGDLISQLFSSNLDPGSGQRQISLDQRVLVMSQTLNLMNAVTTWMHQGTADWGGVTKPLLTSIGGNGALSALDIFNHTLGLDNQEARMVMRTSVSAWLSASAREVGGIELAKSFGGGANATPLTSHLRDMQLAALANDHLDFQQAYQAAVQAARDLGDENPERKVLEGWRSRSPLAVFKGKPTQSEMSAMLGVMDPTGQDAVRSALRNYDSFTKTIQPTESQKRENRVQSQIRSAGRLPVALRSSQTAFY